MLLQKLLARIHELQSNLHTSQKSEVSKDWPTHSIKNESGAKYTTNPVPNTHHLCAYQLESLLLEPLDDLRHQSALNAVGLDHDESSFAGHSLHPINVTLSFKQNERSQRRPNPAVLI
jgi:hypothetical protein